ncbi:MAG: hypothetical protein ACJ77N_06305 [Chloroflexota bacterium]|jgi:hypothetical protein
MSLVLVVARPRAQESPAGIAGLWGAVRDEVARVKRVDNGALGHRTLDELAAQLGPGAVDAAVTYATDPDGAAEATEQAIDAGAGHVVVLPVAIAVDETSGTSGDAGDELDVLRNRIDGVCRGHPDVEVTYVGPPFADPPALEAAIGLLRASDSEEPALLGGAIDRAFDGDRARFGRFMTTLQRGLPAGTRIALRGSAVQGESYKTGEPFDAKGPHTSDLDVVLFGETAMAEWHPDAFYFPGVNTYPLDDENRWVAPRLDPVRSEAQEIAGRPVAVQAMARWFLDLRSGLQGTPYVVLDA